MNHNRSNTVFRLAQFNLYYALFIILWGAWVRLSGSGAGCGEHWPLCDGEIIPMAAGAAKLIEFTHRATTGIFGFTILAQFYLVFKKYAPKHPARLSVIMILVLTLIESLIGAFLVKKGLVVDNDSLLRAFVIALHLINTFFLLSALVAGVYYCQKDIYTFKKWDFFEKSFFTLSFILLLFVGATGAIAALGNTLFPVESLSEGIRADFSKHSPILIQLRVLHPIFAVGTSLFLFFGIFKLLDKKGIAKKQGQIFLILLGVHLIFGFVNWLLMAPVWGALTHLLFADLVWIGLVYLCLELWSSRELENEKKC